MREGYRELPDMQASDPCYMVSDELLDLYGPCTQVMVKDRKIRDIRGCLYFAWNFKMAFPSITYYRSYLSIGGSDNGVYQGIRTAEMYLNRAEGYIRKYMAGGDASLNDLNELRRHRFNNVEYTYEEVNITDPDDLFKFYQEERRRELAGDWMHRWCDLRRYGMPEINHTFFETASGNKTEVTLQKNRYVLPIAEEVIRLNPRLEQNK